MLSKKEQKSKRQKRIRAKIKGVSKTPRLCVFRSNQHIYCQLIDDEKGKAILSAYDGEIKIKKGERKAISSEKSEKELTGPTLVAFELGKLIGQKAKDKKISQVVFDRAGYKYHGKVKAVADGARSSGLKF